jgi:hypothetical protein
MVKDLFPKMEMGSSNPPTCKPKHINEMSRPFAQTGAMCLQTLGLNPNSLLLTPIHLCIRDT